MIEWREEFRVLMIKNSGITGEVPNWERSLRFELDIYLAAKKSSQVEIDELNSRIDKILINKNGIIADNLKEVQKLTLQLEKAEATLGDIQVQHFSGNDNQGKMHLLARDYFKNKEGL